MRIKYQNLLLGLSVFKGSQSEWFEQLIGLFFMSLTHSCQQLVNKCNKYPFLKPAPKGQVGKIKSSIKGNH